MRSKSNNTGRSEAGWGLKMVAWGVVLFLHIPLFLIILYAFSSEDKSFGNPPAKKHQT